MGKTDKTQARLQFERRKAISPAGEGAEVGPQRSPVATSGEDQDLHQILEAMQHSLTQIDGKLDSLSYRMERLDQSERRVSEVEDSQTELATSQVKLNKELSTLRLKTCGGSGLIRPYRDKNALMTIEAESGGEIVDSKLIAARFRDFYQSLYTSKVDPDPVALLDYLTHITMPQLTDTDREALMAPLTLSEMTKALGGMAEGICMFISPCEICAFHEKLLKWYHQLSKTFYKLLIVFAESIK
ncbi:hypothetical protein NDU88_005575 [Pleurodeles waltl]|uniref:t-SNARE coiled-coil homology domain-containing protein n=1 Tax=Pleurodeles waltl TaxID=8319 RepID=A0AAV7N4T4_PLEWA|nr:hypothetical protein NDU88_005575 [Pleurodeles waltl]